jgi:hypothetical protein
LTKRRRPNHYEKKGETLIFLREYVGENSCFARERIGASVRGQLTQTMTHGLSKARISFESFSLVAFVL